MISYIITPPNTNHTNNNIPLHSLIPVTPLTLSEITPNSLVETLSVKQGVTSLSEDIPSATVIQELKKIVEYIIQVGAHVGNISNYHLNYHLYNNIKPNFLYIIQVGAHIGNISNDHLYNNIKPNFLYIIIEPVPYLFTQLIENYKSYNNIICLNIAISNYNGYIDLYIPSDKNDFTKLVSWCSQLASTNKDHIHTFVPECIVDKISIECKTLNTLIKEYNITDLEYLYTDTEGHDYDILMDLDLSFIRPKNILFENKHMDGPKHTLDINNCPKYYNLLNHFKKYGYEVELQTSEDTCLKLVTPLNI